MNVIPKFDGPGLLIVLSGPSGVGKNTVVDRLVERPSRTRLVTATTRGPRAGERDGVDYLFLSTEEFRGRVEDGFFLEHTETYGDLYGSPIEPVREAVTRGDVIFLVIDVKGGERLRELGVDALYIFVAPPDTGALISRLERRATEDAPKRDARIERAKEELEASKTYDYVVINRENDIASAVADIEEIIRRELGKR